MRFSEDKLAALTCSDRIQRTVHIWEPTCPKAVILAIHGGMAHAGDYVTPALFFRGQDVATVSFDMCGHDGKRRVDIPGFDILLDDAVLFLAWVKKTYPGLPIFLMGHSMGGLIATHLELGRFSNDRDIKGVILSSPYYMNAVKVPQLLLWFSGVLSKLFPTQKVPLESLTNLLTHDPLITARHLADEKDGIRATEASFRFAASLLSAQKALIGKMTAWTHPVFAVLAGDDKLANPHVGEAMLREIPGSLLEYHFYPDNFHENFNEVSRHQIFRDISVWMDKRLEKS